MYTDGEVKVQVPETAVTRAVLFEDSNTVAFAKDTVLLSATFAVAVASGKYSSCTVPPEMVQRLQFAPTVHAAHPLDNCDGQAGVGGRLIVVGGGSLLSEYCV